MISIDIKVLFIVTTTVFNVCQTNAVFESPPDCGQKGIQRPNQRIVGGIKSDVNEFPFMVSLRYVPLNDYHFCGASVLSKRWVLTAAHCVKGLLKNINEMKLIVGSIYMKDTESQKSYSVDKWIINGCFGDDSFDGDIALIKTSEDIDINNTNIGSICLPPKDSEPIGSDIELSGWGVWTETSAFDSTEDAPSVLQKVRTTLVSEEFCATYDYFRNQGVYHPFSNGKKICIRNEDSTACRGDSGGPAFQMVNNKVYAIGVASHISILLPISNKCSKGNPVYYTKISKYIDWIRNSIEQYESSSKTQIETKCSNAL